MPAFVLMFVASAASAARRAPSRGVSSQEEAPDQAQGVVDRAARIRPTTTVLIMSSINAADSSSLTVLSRLSHSPVRSR
ncbi:hypothetical protein BC835DRAFT_1319501 [Cytidiella melzeri]|nr:hypothetical protein BC835DRAFT_1319501 [Cytidiella melzeri]